MDSSAAPPRLAYSRMPAAVGSVAQVPQREVSTETCITGRAEASLVTGQRRPAAAGVQPATPYASATTAEPCLTQHALVVAAQVCILAATAPGEHLANELQRARGAACENQLQGGHRHVALRRLAATGRKHCTGDGPAAGNQCKDPDQQCAVPHLILCWVGTKQSHQLAAHAFHLPRRPHAGGGNAVRIAVRCLPQILHRWAGG